MNNHDHMLTDCSVYKCMDQEESDMDRVGSRYVVDDKEAAGRGIV